MKLSFYAAMALSAALFGMTASAAHYRTMSVPDESGILPPVKTFGLRMPSRALPDTRSPMLRLGENSPLVPPFCETFDNFRAGNERDDFYRYFQTIDADNDGRCWGLYNYQTEIYGRHAYLLFAIDKPANDDWLIPRAIRLKGGKYYRFSMLARSYSPDANLLYEVKYGYFNEAAELNMTVVPPTTVTGTEFERSEGWIVPDEDGLYYVGIHGISPSTNTYLFVDNIALSAAREPTVPDAVTDLSFSNNPDGEPLVNITFKTPEKDISGKPLGSLTKIEVMRDDKVVKTFLNPSVGSICSFDDNVGEDGEFEYVFVPYNADGTGLDCREIHYVGIGAPEAPKLNSVIETNGNGAVRVEWTAPSKDVYGNDISSDKLNYELLLNENSDFFPLVTGIRGTSVETQVNLSEGEQMLALFGLTALINDNVSDMAYSDVIPIGKPYSYPHHNSFTIDDYYRYVLGIYSLDNISWMMQSDGSDPKSQDGDNGYVAMIGNAPGQKSELQTGKLDLTEAVNPLLTFYTYVYSYDENIIRIFVEDCATKERTLAGTVNLADYNKVGWQRVMVPVTAAAGKVVRLGIEGQITTHGYIPVDNMSVAEMPQIDLSIDEVSIPASVRPGNAFDVGVTISNNGCREVVDYEVQLLRGDVKVCSASGRVLGSTEKVSVVLKDSLDASYESYADYRVCVVVAGDENEADNSSEVRRVTLVLPAHPYVTDLRAEEDGNMVTLAWSVPDTDNAAPDETTDDFESYKPFVTGLVGDWLTEDVDGLPIGGINGVEIPGKPEGSQQSFWVTNNDDEYGLYFIPTRSGSQAMTQLFCSNGPCDDWLISPELYGGPQTIDFWAVALSEDYGPERFEVLYSTTDRETDSFIVALPETSVGYDWENFFVALPDDARYFAIRCVSDNVYMMIVDDVTFIGKGAPRTLQLKGYNVYRNHVRINDALVETTSYVTSRSAETDTYCVTAVYDLGESRGSNYVKLGESSLESVVTPVMKLDVVGHTLYVYGEDETSVYTPDGRCVYSGQNDMIALP